MPTASSAAGYAPLVMGYYPDWAGKEHPPEKIDFGRFDWIDFAFAVPDQNMTLSWDGSDDAPDLLRRLVSRAHENGKRVKLSVGGWTGSKCVPFLLSSVFSRLCVCAPARCSVRRHPFCIATRRVAFLGTPDRIRY